MELLIIGSSIVKILDAKKIEKRSPDKARVMSGAKVNDVKKRLIEVNEKYNAKKMVIHAGGNNIPQEDPNSLTNNICSFFIIMFSSEC